MPQGLPAKAPGELIESAHINAIADRVVGRFATMAELVAAIPTATTGMVSSVAGRPVVYTAGTWKTVAPSVRVYGPAAALNPVPPAGGMAIPQVNFTMPAAGMVTFTYQISVAMLSGTTASTWEATIEGTGFTASGTCRAYWIVGMPGLYLAGSHSFELAAGARYGRVLLKRVAGDAAVQSFASAYGLEIVY